LKNFGNDILKQYAMTQKIKKKYLESHEIGEIYIHNIECIPTGITGFTQLDLLEKLEEDFTENELIKNQGENIYTYTNIITNIMLLTAREQYYGEGIPAFDFLLAKGVLKTFKQNFKKILIEYLEFTEFLQFLPMNGILREIERIESIRFDIQIFRQYLRESDKVFEIFEKAYTMAIIKTEKDTYKAIEMFVHNLNMLSEDREQEMIFSLNLGTDTSDER
jgi:anaerobic ribonucleoside-triphosphate reductase